MAPRPRQWMTVAGLFAIIALTAFVTDVSVVGNHGYQAPRPWVWFVLAAVFCVAAVEAGRRSIVDRRHLRSPLLRASDRGTSDH